MSDVIGTAFLKNFLKIFFSLSILSFFFYIMTPFLISIILGGILALALIPFVDYFVRQGFKRTTSVLMFTSLAGVIGLIPVAAFLIHGSRVILRLLQKSNISEFIQRLTNMSYSLVEKFCALYGFDQEVIRGKVALLVVYRGNYLYASFSSLIAESPTILMTGSVITLSAYFFLRESDKIRKLFDRYFYFTQDNGNKFVHTFKICCREVFSQT
jgi:predicted PurR-regulated permease PerM